MGAQIDRNNPVSAGDSIFEYFCKVLSQVGELSHMLVSTICLLYMVDYIHFLYEVIALTENIYQLVQTKILLPVFVLCTTLYFVVSFHTG